MKYWAYVNNEILGPFEKDKLLELPAFTPSLLVCPQTPVGEKTEDWKEASTYPELAALIGSGAGLGAPKAAAPAPAAAPAQEQQHRDVVQPGPAITTFKPLKAASIDPMAPAEHKLGGVEISVNRLGKPGGAEPAPAPAAQPAASAFDPISLSTIVRRAETLSGQEQPQDGIAKEPPKSFSDTAASAGPSGLEISAITRENAAPANDFGAPQAQTPAAPAPEPAPQPAPEPVPQYAPPAEQAPQAAPAAPGGAPVADTAALSALLQRLDAISRASASKQDVASAVDPLRAKLDQMGEAITYIKNSPFQREVMEKLNYLENAVGEMRNAIKNMKTAPAPAPAPAQTVTMESHSDVFMGVQSQPKAEPPKAAAPKEAAKPAEIVDQAPKVSAMAKIGPVLKKVFKGVMTLALLAAVLLGAVIMLKNLQIFDATGFLPFKLPFVAYESAQPAEDPAAQAQAQADADAQAKALAAMAAEEGKPAAQAQPEPMPERAPEVIYFTRTFKLRADGPSLEDKISEHSAKAGGDYNRASWQVKQAVPGIYEIAGVVPSKAGDLLYTFTVNLDEKVLTPADDPGKAAYAALAAASAPKAGARKKGARGAARQDAKPQPKKAAPKKVTPAASEDEYEYVYEEDDGTGE